MKGQSSWPQGNQKDIIHMIHVVNKKMFIDVSHLKDES